MKKQRRVSLRKTIDNLDLSDAKDVLEGKYKYTTGKPGRPPLSPIGMFLSFTIMFLRMESYRDYQAFLEKDQFWRRQLGFKNIPDIGSFTHFLKRIGQNTFEQLFTDVVQQLIDQGFLNLHTVAIDGSIIPAHPDDPDAGWGWDHIEQKRVYGYKIHALVDTHSELPVAITITKANRHDSTQFRPLYRILKNYSTRFPTRFFLADKGYDASYIRKTLQKDHITPVVKAAHVPFEPQYPEWFKDKYRERTSVERFFSRFKQHLDLRKQRIIGCRNVEIYCNIICTGILFAGFFNQQNGFSPRSVKTFLRKYT
jgi:transposase